jgi:lipopolysaccharide/colanic/teichoic acid biosynthesis glycosyltransferase
MSQDARSAPSDERLSAKTSEAANDARPAPLRTITGAPGGASVETSGIAAAQGPTKWQLFCAQLERLRYQLLAGALIGLGIPSVVRPKYTFSVEEFFAYPLGLFGTLGAMLLGVVIFRKVTEFPGARATAYILPSFVLSFGAVMAIFSLLRLDYSRWQFFLSFLLVTAVFYVMHFLAHRGRKTQLAVIPGGDVWRLSELRGVELLHLRSPGQDRSKLPVVADMRADLGEHWERFIADCAMSGRPVYNSKHLYESLSGRVHVEHLSDNTFGGTLISNPIYAAAKHNLDWVVGVLALILLSPLFLIVGLLIRLDSPGPAFFRQMRVGQGGRPFMVYKFRTMRNDVAPPSEESQMTQENDPRITRLGRFLRKTRIDELPQIINIVKHEMSWIGPRPEALLLSRLYEAEIPFYRYRHMVRPGITGWAQVTQGHVTTVEDAHKKLQYDFFYVKNFSFWLDILVSLRTLRVVFSGHGAK